jgi:hypothetical protein
MPGRTNEETAEARWREIWRLHRIRGLGQRRIARTLGVHHSTVQFYIAKGPPPNWKEPPKAEVVSLVGRNRGRGGAA